MKPEILEIMLALIDAPRHGYAIMQFIRERNGGAVEVLPGALYRHLERLESEGLVKVASSDGRRQVYELTLSGVLALREETSRLASAVSFAKDRMAENS